MLLSLRIDRLPGPTHAILLAGNALDVVVRHSAFERFFDRLDALKKCLVLLLKLSGLLPPRRSALETMAVEEGNPQEHGQCRRRQKTVAEPGQ